MTTLSVEELCSYVTQKTLTSGTSHEKLTVSKPMTNETNDRRLELDKRDHRQVETKIKRPQLLHPCTHWVLHTRT
jgi:hypothetical protein